MSKLTIALTQEELIEWAEKNPIYHTENFQFNPKVTGQQKFTDAVEAELKKGLKGFLQEFVFTRINGKGVSF